MRPAGHLGVSLAACFTLACVLAASCSQELDAQASPAELDRDYFTCRVQPVLTETCAMFACHGDSQRVWRIFARNRLRYGGTEAQRNEPLREQELHMNYLATRALVNAQHPDQSLLLLKPLEQSAGGAFHRGATLFGMGNVFRDREDAHFQALHAWVNGATAADDPGCEDRLAAARDAGTEDAGGAP